VSVDVITWIDDDDEGWSCKRDLTQDTAATPPPTMQMSSALPRILAIERGRCARDVGVEHCFKTDPSAERQQHSAPPGRSLPSKEEEEEGMEDAMNNNFLNFTTQKVNQKKTHHPLPTSANGDRVATEVIAAGMQSRKN
jgi:hypothetical protein